MRISRRTSGGRGEYEISEKWGGITPHDLVGHPITINFSDGIYLETNTELREQGGKLRLRRLKTTGMQIPRQVAAALLMPHPVRADYSLGTGSPVMKRNQYAINHMHLIGLSLTSAKATIQLGTVALRNQMHDPDEISVGLRIQLLRRVWNERDQFPEDIANLVAEHERHVLVNRSAGTAVEKTTAKLEALVSESAQDLDILYSEGTDVLHALTEALDLVRVEPGVPLSEVDPEEPELRRRISREWKRWASTRGAASAKFRVVVRVAYDSTCAVCGQHLPATTNNRQPGVDAAHILPWAEYDLDHVSNGICLCKTHHWAFDEGLLRIRFQDGGYHVEVPDDVRESILGQDPDFSFAALSRYEGQIPSRRLPKDPADKPHPGYLERLNEELDMV